MGLVRTRTLSEAEKRFALEYVRTMNRAEAYHIAYPGAGWSTCRNRPSVLMRRVEVQAEVERLREFYREKFGLAAEKVIQERMKVAFSNIGDVAEWDGGSVRLVPKSELSREVTAGVAEIRMTENGPSVKMHPGKLEALKDLGKFLGIDTERVAVDVRVTHDLSEVARATVERIRAVRAEEVAVENA
jgi:hypothetical protein